MSENINALSSELRGGGQLQGFSKNLVNLRNKELGILCADRTICTDNLSAITFTTSDTFLNLKEFNIMIQHNFAQFNDIYANYAYRFIIAGWTAEGEDGSPITIATFPIQNTTTKFNTLLSQVKLCGNLTVQNFIGSPTTLEPMYTMWGGWTTTNHQDNVIIADTALNTYNDSTLNGIAENRTQCTKPIKRLMFYLQNGAGAKVVMPSGAYLHITIYGIQN